jgi:hypothetical protein
MSYCWSANELAHVFEIMSAEPYQKDGERLRLTWVKLKETEDLKHMVLACFWTTELPTYPTYIMRPPISRDQRKSAGRRSRVR